MPIRVRPGTEISVDAFTGKTYRTGDDIPNGLTMAHVFNIQKLSQPEYNGGRELTHAEIAAEAGVTEEDVRIILTNDIHAT